MKTLFMIGLGLSALVVLLGGLYAICFCIYQVVTLVIDLISIHRYNPEEEKDRMQDIMDW